MLDHFWLGGPGVQQNNFRCYRCRSIHRGAGIGGRPAGQGDFMDLHGSLTDATIPSTASHKENRAAAVGGRIGFLIAPQVLTYVNGAWTSTLFSEVDFPGGAFSFPAHTFSGGFIGGGTEVAVAGMPGLYWAAGGRIGVLVTSQVLTYVNGGWTSTRLSGVDFPRGQITLPAQTFSGGFIGGGAEFAVADFFDHQSATVQTITTSLILRARDQISGACRMRNCIAAKASGATLSSMPPCSIPIIAPL